MVRTIYGILQMVRTIYGILHKLQLVFLAAGVTETIVNRSTGVTTANSTNKYQKYKSVELDDQQILFPGGRLK